MIAESLNEAVVNLDKSLDEAKNFRAWWNQVWKE